MVIMFFIVLGVAGFSFTGSDLFPDTNMPFITVITIYPGAGASEIESQIIDPIEEAVSSINGLKRSISATAEGVAVSVLEFTMDTRADDACDDVQKAVDAIAYKLPEEAKKPIIQKYHMNAQPVFTVVLSGNRPLAELHSLAGEKVKERFEPLAGVGEVSIEGGLEREIQIEVDRFKMEGYGLSIDQVIQRLEIENMNVPAGTYMQAGTEYTIRTLSEFKSLQEIRNLEIPLHGGVVPLQKIAGPFASDKILLQSMINGSVRLSEIADVKDSYKEKKVIARLNGKEAVGISVKKQSDASIVGTVKTLEKELELIKKTLPEDISLEVAYNGAKFVRLSLGDTRNSLIEGIITCGLVLTFFLRSWRSVFTVMMAIPTSIISTFFMIFLFGYTFNIVSLLALTLCVGILVDDSIVVLENIHRHREMGKNPVLAALDGRYEIGLAAVSITLQDVVVFLPLAFMTGLVGQFFKQFGMTVVFATVFSLFVSFTLTPMMAALLEKEEAEGHKKAGKKKRDIPPVIKLLLKKMNLFGNSIMERYLWSLEWALDHRGWIFSLILLGMIICASLVPTGIIGQEFLPIPDQGRFSITVELPYGTPLERTEEICREIENRLLKIPEINNFYTRVGVTSSFFTGSGSFMAEMNVNLIDKGDRKRSVWDVVNIVRGWKNDFPDTILSVAEAPVPGTGDKGAPVQLHITGPNEQIVGQLSKKIQKIVENTPGACDVRSTWKDSGQPEIEVRVDKLRAHRHGLSAGEIAMALRASFEGETAGKYREGGKEYDIRVRLDKIDIQNINDIKSIRVINHAGQGISIGDVTDIKKTAGRTNKNHMDRQHMVNISANTVDRALGNITGDIKKEIERTIDIPPGYKYEFYGNKEDMEESFSDMVGVIILSVCLVYMLLVILYESFLTPVIRLLSLPCALGGALLALYITNETLNLMTLLGLVMLDGLAAKNGTLLIDYTNTLLKRGIPLREALITACRTRLRPITMTALTMIAGMIPTALAVAEGVELRRGMAVALIGGMLTSLILTPLLIPAAYLSINNLVNSINRHLPWKTRISLQDNELIDETCDK